MPRKTITQIEAEHAEQIMYRDERIEELKKALRDAEKCGDQSRFGLRKAEKELDATRELLRRTELAYASLRGAFLIVEGGGVKKLSLIDRGDKGFNFEDDGIPF